MKNRTTQTAKHLAARHTKHGTAEGRDASEGRPGHGDTNEGGVDDRTDTEIERLLRQGDTRFEAGDWDGAITCYRAAMALDPYHPEPRPLLVDALYRRASSCPEAEAYRDETVMACEEALRFDPDCPTAAHFLTRMLQDLGHQEEAYWLHEQSMLRKIRGARDLIVDMGEGEINALARKMLCLKTLIVDGLHLMAAYVREAHGQPICWDGYLSEPVAE